MKGDKTTLLRRDNETGKLDEHKNYQEWYSDKKLSEGMQRRWSNVNKPSEYAIRPRLSAVRAKSKEYGLDLKGIKIKINRDEMAKVIGMYGSAPSEEDGVLYLYLNAFSDDETLIRTILHEKEHIRQYNKYGADYVMNNPVYFEEKARKAEEIWYNLLKNKERK